MALLARNNATSTLSATLTNVATSLSVQSGHGVRFPNPTGGDYFYVAIIGVGKYEVVKVTARSTDSMTIVRAQDNTTADSFSSGDAVKLLVTAVYITDTWTELGLKAPINSPTFTGTPAAPTAAVDTNTTQLATTAYVVGQGYAKLASPTFTGTPAAPTAAVDTNTTQLATTAYVVGQGYLKSATASSTYQPLDADLTSIAGLGYSATSFLKKTAANTWALDTTTYEPTISAGTTGQYWRGDKSWQTLNASAVGLGNVTNESKATMFSSPTFTGAVTANTSVTSAVFYPSADGGITNWYIGNNGSNGLINWDSNDYIIYNRSTNVGTFNIGAIEIFGWDANGINLTKGQLAFPPTQNASSNVNCLDDYEEGTFTPSLGGTTTYFAQTGNYTKIGRVVHFDGQLYINALGTGSATTISGLPFAANNARNFVCVPAVWSGCATSVVSIYGYVPASSSTVVFLSLTGAGTAPGANNIFGASAYMDFGGHYYV